MPMQTHGPSKSPEAQPSKEPQWTTGQGIGFLVAFSGWMLAAFSFIADVAVVGFMEVDEDIVPVAFGLLTGLGAVSAIPGTIVFHKCKTPPVEVTGCNTKQ